MKKKDDDTHVTGPILEVPSGKFRPHADAIVVVLHPPAANPGRRFTLSREEHFVGRRRDLDLPIDVDSVSRRHARFFRNGDEWWLEDLQSTNGTYVNDEQISRRRLEDGDIVRFGEAVSKFLSGTHIERAYHEEIYRLSILDGLTGIHNKRFFDEVLEREVARSLRHGNSLALVMFDIDLFKIVNDTHGHVAGDAVLQSMCRRLRPRIRREDLLARIGGEEFACILPDTPLQGAVSFAEDLRGLVEKEPFPFEGTSIRITISLGVAVLEPSVTDIRSSDDSGRSLTEARDTELLFKRADEQLYEAKKRGRNRVCF
ncbi:MAG TPA: GGDEF domain-containing protein [Haliangiales bacterium]|nr:GGDEF domain-containing protein [Haliangiales bacterium]